LHGSETMHVQRLGGHRARGNARTRWRTDLLNRTTWVTKPDQLLVPEKMNPYRLVSAITSSGRKQSLRTRRTVAATWQRRGSDVAATHATLAAKETVGRVEYRSATDNAA
jgi:hypothetical protein